MTEDEARGWLAARNVPRGTIDALARFVALLMAEAGRQNLVAASTLEAIWARHIVDSAQLLDLAPQWRSWVDLGSGAGFPGLIVALLSDGNVTLVETRAKRVAFLREAVNLLEIGNRVDVFAGRVEAMPQQSFDVISARAFAPLTRTLAIAHELADARTIWILPKGKSAAQELAEIGASWQGRFELVPSITDSAASIVVARGVAPGKRR